MQAITLTVTPDVLNLILQALNDSVVHRQQSIAVLISNIQSQANAQLQAAPEQSAQTTIVKG